MPIIHNYNVQKKQPRIYIISCLFFVFANIALSGISHAQSWKIVGISGFSGGPSNSNAMAIEGSGTPYMVYADVDDSSKVTVMKYNGSMWVTVGAAGFSAGEASGTSIAIDLSGTPYVFYTDYANGMRATVMKYDGSSWVTAGTAGFSAGIAQGYSALHLKESLSGFSQY